MPEPTKFPLGTPPEFPYGWLVRFPLFCGLVFILDIFISGSNFPVTYCGHSEWIKLVAVLLPGYLQLFAIPVGLYVVITRGHARSLRHWAALLCGLSFCLHSFCSRFL